MTLMVRQEHSGEDAPFGTPISAHPQMNVNNTNKKAEDCCLLELEWL